VVQLDLELDEESSHSTAGTAGSDHLHVMAGKPSLPGRPCVLRMQEANRTSLNVL